jgi:hypothetical protein
MAQQVIGIGTSANDGTGDPLRTAFDKSNDNFTELYADNTANLAAAAEFNNSYRCAINEVVTTGSNEIMFSSTFTDANYLLEIQDPLGIVTSLDAQDADSFTITVSGNGTIHYKATYIK